MKKIMKVMLLGSALTFSAASNAVWTSYDNVVGNFYTPAVTTIVLDLDYHACGNNRWGNLRHSTVGADFAKTFNAVLLTAITTDRTVALNIDGCEGTRANVTGIRLGD